MTRDAFGIVGTTQRGSFRVERVVAEGGFSVVYKAYHGAFRAPVALKCLKVPGTIKDAEAEAFMEKLREEAELLFRLSASIPEVVRPLHVDTLELDRFVPFLALEWLEGEALDELLARRAKEGQAPMTAYKLVRLLTPVARGLAKAHRFPGPMGVVSVVHRDIKPENILIANVNGEDVVKILDFGIAKAQAVAELRATRTAGEDDVRSAFTPAYGAPEQWAPREYGATGPWTDVWGLAMTLVEALTGKPPIDGEMPQMMAAVLDPFQRPTPRTLGAQVPDEVEKAFARALEVDPKKRTQDVEKFWAELEAAIGIAPTLGRRDSRREMPSTGQKQPAATSAPDPHGQTVPASASSIEAARGARLPAVPTLDIPALGVPAPPITEVPISAPVSSGDPARTPASKRKPITASEGPFAFEDADFGAKLDIDPKSGFDRVSNSSSRLSSPTPYSQRAIAPPPSRTRDIRSMLKLPVQLAILGVIIGVGDIVLSKVLDAPVTIGPLRPVWLSVALVIGGVLAGFWRLLGDDNG